MRLSQNNHKKAWMCFEHVLSFCEHILCILVSQHIMCDHIQWCRLSVAHCRTHLHYAFYLLQKIFPTFIDCWVWHQSGGRDVKK